MAESSQSTGTVSREEFNDLKSQIAEMTALLKEQCKIKDHGQNKIGNDGPPIFQFKAKDRHTNLDRENEKDFVNLSGDQESTEVKRKVQKLEDDIRSMRGIGSYGSVKYPDLCIFPGARFPDKFQIPDFEKYNGVGDPYTHLKVYIGELGSYAEDEGLRMQLFQKSLTGEARTWYARLDNNKIHNWEDLAQAFLAQYSFQSLMAPDRYQMTKVKKSVDESFRDYAQRWRRMAAQVNPPMSENEMVMTFIDIQEAPYYERVLSGIGKPFSEMVKHGEMAEMGLKTGKIRDFTTVEPIVEYFQTKDYGSIHKRSGRKEEEDVSFVSQGQSWRPDNNSSRWMKGSSRQLQRQSAFNQSQDEKRKFERTEYRKFTPLGDSLENILNLLIAQKKITELAPLVDPKSKRYNPTKRCAYHSGSPGHDTQECWSLKHKIQNLIDSGDIAVEQIEPPNVNVNPVPQYYMDKVNMIGSEDTEMDPNCKNKWKIEEYPRGSETNVLAWEYAEEIKIIKQELELVRHQMKQLADLVVDQHQITRQLFSQLVKSQEKEEVSHDSSQNRSQMIPVVEEDQNRLKEQEKRSDKIPRRSHQWNSKNCTGKNVLTTENDQSISRRDRKFTPLNKSKEEMLHFLISKGKITELLPSMDPKTKRYDPTKFCLYHSNSPGHATEECWALKHKIQNLIENGELNIAGNHETPTIRKGKEKMKRIPPKTISSKGMTVMISKLREARSGSVINEGLTNEIEKDYPSNPEPFILTSRDLKDSLPKNWKLTPLVNCSHLDAYKGCVERRSDQISDTNEDIPNTKVASIAAVKDNMTIDD